MRKAGLQWVACERTARALGAVLDYVSADGADTAENRSAICSGFFSQISALARRSE
jgi:hypothetical protein